MDNVLQLSNHDEVLIFRSAGIGDFLVVLPFINYLLNEVGISEKKIHFVIINNQNLNPLKLVFDKNCNLVKNSSVLNMQNGFAEIIKIKNNYKNKNISKILYLQFVNEPLASKIKKILAIKYVTGINKHIYGLDFKKSHSNIGTQYLTYFEKLGLDNFSRYLNFDINDLLKFTNKEIYNCKQIGLNKNKKNIAIYMNSKLKMKIWSKNNYIKLIEYINSKYNADIYLVGGTEDIGYNDDFIRENKLKNIVNIAAKLSIRETIFLFNSFDLLVGNDGAPLHMAAYSHCAILGIYTYKEEVTAWEPFKSKKFITYRKNLFCKHCYLEFCENPICIESLKFEDIKSGIDDLLTVDKIKQARVVY